MGLWTTDVMAVGAILLGAGTSHLLYAARGPEESAPEPVAVAETGSTIHVHSDHLHQPGHCRGLSGLWFDVRLEPLRRDILHGEARARREEVSVRREEARLRREEARIRREVARIEVEMQELASALEETPPDVRAPDRSIRWW